MAGIVWSEIILVFSGFFLLLAYHVHLAFQVRNKPLTTSFGITHQTRHAWAEWIREQGRDILAVQTLRNWTMAASFLASTAILMSLAMLNIAFRSEAFIDVTKALNFLGSENEALWLIKWFLLAMNFFVAFFNFTLSIRYYNHAGFMINVPAEKNAMITPDYIARILNRGATHYTFGMRGYYLSVPLILWLYGPVWMFAGTVILLAALYVLDRRA